MKFSAVKRYRKKHRALGALLVRNPVLVMGLDLPFVIGSGISLRGAAALSLQMVMIHVVTMAVGYVTCRKLSTWARALVNVTVSTMMMMAARSIITVLLPGVYTSLGMYIYLMAVNSMTMLQSVTIDKNVKPWPVISGAFLNAMGFALVVAVVSFVRELFGNGTLWAIPVQVPFKLTGLQLPFAGFIIMGFLLALVRFVNKRLLAFSMLEAAKREANLARIEIQSVEPID